MIKNYYKLWHYQYKEWEELKVIFWKFKELIKTYFILKE